MAIPQKVRKLGRFYGHEDIELLTEFLAVSVEWEIVDVVSKGILEFVSDGGETHDDVGCGDGAGNGDPFQSGKELEGEEVDVEEHDLGD